MPRRSDRILVPTYDPVHQDSLDNEDHGNEDRRLASSKIYEAVGERTVHSALKTTHAPIF